jgi:hypothetical protein
MRIVHVWFIYWLAGAEHLPLYKMPLCSRLVPQGHLNIFKILRAVGIIAIVVSYITFQLHNLVFYSIESSGFGFIGSICQF